MTLPINALTHTNTSFRAAEDNNKKDKSNVAEPKVQKSDIVDDFVKEGTTPNTKKSPKTAKKLLQNSLDTWQNFLKFKARAKEYTKGVINGAIVGLGVGASVMSLDWAMNGIARVSKKEAKSTIFITEPAKVVGHAFSKVFKTIYNIPDLTIRQLAKNTLHAPIDLFHYVKDAQNVTKVGKCFAPLLGGTAMAYCLAKSVLRANNKVADIEHAFNSGHAHDLK